MIKLYRSNYDEFNPDNNGGDRTNIRIESGVANSFIPRVRPRQAEKGATRWFKFYITTTQDIVTIGVDVAKFTDSPTEEIYISDDTSDYESDIDKDNIRLYGGFKVNDVDIDNKQITADRSVADFVKNDDTITFYDKDNNRIIALKVDSVDNDKITLKKWGDRAVTTDYWGSSTIYFDTLNSDEDKQIWIKQTIKEFTEAMENPLDSFVVNIWYDYKK